MKRKALGKGLRALIPEEAPVELKEVIRDIEIEKILPNPHQPRTSFHEEDLNELADSIKDYGLIQPVIVRSLGGEIYELIAGERRLKAAKIAGFSKVPCLVKAASDNDSIVMALVENIHRVNLNPIEEAKAYEALMKESGVTHNDISKKIKKSRAYVTNILRLLKLPVEVQGLVVEEKLTVGHVRPLIGLNKSQVMSVINNILHKNLSVRAVENIVKRITEPPEKKKKKSKIPEILEIEEKLQAAFGTKVRIDYGKSKGRIGIYFYSDEDLSRIIDIFLRKH